jgi:glycosyltransferase involved in cell wall biosynthesis
MIIDVLIPALNEEASLPLVLADLRVQPVPLRHVVVIDNGSTDRTGAVAQEGGAVVLSEPRRGYGAACLRGIRFLTGRRPPPDVVVFLDADRSDDATELPRLIAALMEGADLVIGSRVLGSAEPGALAPAQRVGNFIAVHLIRLLYGHRYTDLGPFRAIRYPALLALGMRDPGYGWTVEMQVKAARFGLLAVEVPVSYRRRAAGRSKVSGTLAGTLGAGYKILYTILRYATVL